MPTSAVISENIVRTLKKKKTVSYLLSILFCEYFITITSYIFTKTRTIISLVIFLWSRCDFMNELAFAVVRIAT